MSKEKLIYEEIFDSIPDGILILDNDLNIVSINESSENLLNISRTKTSGNHISKYFPEEIIKLCRSVLENERIIHEEEFNFRTPLNSIIPIGIVGSPIYDKKGETEGLILQVKDREKLNLLSKIHGNETIEEDYQYLIRGIAHELNNPLSGIKGAAQLLNNNLSKDEVNKCSEIIIKEVDRLKNLIERLKRLDNFDKDSFGPVNIQELLMDILFLESNLHTNIKFITKFDITIPEIHGDETSLKQVFMNLIKNSVDAIGKNGQIEIKTKWVTEYRIKSKNNIQITIKDNGKGIIKKNINKIFTPFYSSKKNGTGLGLFISSQIIAKHGGVIMVKSEPKKGTEFNIHLPLK